MITDRRTFCRWVGGLAGAVLAAPLLPAPQRALKMGAWTTPAATEKVWWTPIDDAPELQRLIDSSMLEHPVHITRRHFRLASPVYLMGTHGQSKGLRVDYCVFEWIGPVKEPIHVPTRHSYPIVGHL